MRTIIIFVFTYFSEAIIIFAFSISLFQQTMTAQGQQVSAILSVLAAILNLGNVEVSPHPHTGHPHISNKETIMAGKMTITIVNLYISISCI